MDELNKQGPLYQISTDVFRRVGTLMSDLVPHHLARAGNIQGVAAAHTSGIFQALMGALLINQRYAGSLPEVMSHNDLMGNPEAVKLLMEDLAGLMRETLSYTDPEATYAVTIVRKDKKE